MRGRSVLEVRAGTQGGYSGVHSRISPRFSACLLMTWGPRNTGTLTRSGLPERVYSCFENMWFPHNGKEQGSVRRFSKL